MKNSKKTNVIVLSSGGIDSTACIDFYLSKDFSVSSLFIDFGQLSSRLEYKASKMISNFYKTRYKRVVVKNPIKFNSGLIQGRNAFFLATALLYFKDGNGIIALGIHSGTRYIDCSKEFILEMQKIFDLYTNGAIVIGAPFVDFTKDQIWQYCQINKIPVNLTYSCERGMKQPCGKCNSCKDLIKLYGAKN